MVILTEEQAINSGLRVINPKRAEIYKNGADAEVVKLGLCRQLAKDGLANSSIVAVLHCEADYVDSVLDQLSKSEARAYRDKLIIVLHELGLTVRQLAEVFSCGVGTVHRTLKTAKA